MMTKLTPTEQQLNHLIQAGYDRFNPDLRQPGETAATCAAWLEAWELVKQMTPPEVRAVEAFDAAHPHFQPPIANWLSDLERELHKSQHIDSLRRDTGIVIATK